MTPTCSNCGEHEFVWASELRTGGRLSAGSLSLRAGGELPLGTRICVACGHADLFLRDMSILRAPHHWKPGEFTRISGRGGGAPSASPAAPPTVEPAPPPASPPTNNPPVMISPSIPSESARAPAPASSVHDEPALVPADLSREPVPVITPVLPEEGSSASPEPYHGPETRPSAYVDAAATPPPIEEMQAEAIAPSEGPGEGRPGSAPKRPASKRRPSRARRT